MIALHHGDCREVIPTLGMMVDAVVTDPPYDLKFMGQSWDEERVAFDPGTWMTIGTALRPGGFLIAFGGTRTYHRMVGAIEDAGFVIQDCLMWLYATGFPKRRDALKPAYEPIVLAYKPGGKRTMQVDECRIEGTWTRDSTTRCDIRGNAFIGGVSGGLPCEPQTAHENGRWPANICHDGSDEVLAAFPESASARASGNPNNPYRGTNHIATSCGQGDGKETVDYRDTGSTARFFFSAKAGTEDRWGSRHPTVKPVDLIAWLVALVTPPGGTFLDPFAGSGTAAVAALKTGRNAILIEREAGYVADIKQRIAFYEGGGQHSAQAKHRNRKIDHGPLFAPQPLTPDEDAADSLASYNAAVMAIGERVKAGAPVPEFMLSKRRPEQS